VTEPERTAFRFSSSGPQWGTYVSAPTSLFLLALLLWYLHDNYETYGIAISLAVAWIPLLSLWSCAYTIWGRCDVEIGSEDWRIVRRIGPFQRRREISIRDVGKLDLHTLARAEVPFPSFAGLHVQVERIGSPLKFRIGSGLGLGRDSVRELFDALEASRAVRLRQSKEHW
jgi:hypothetical protein